MAFILPQLPHWFSNLRCSFLLCLVAVRLFDLLNSFFMAFIFFYVGHSGFHHFPKFMNLSLSCGNCELVVNVLYFDHWFFFYPRGHFFYIQLHLCLLQLLSSQKVPAFGVWFLSHFALYLFWVSRRPAVSFFFYVLSFSLFKFHFIFHIGACRLVMADSFIINTVASQTMSILLRSILV